MEYMKYMPWFLWGAIVLILIWKWLWHRSRNRPSEMYDTYIKIYSKEHYWEIAKEIKKLKEIVIKTFEEKIQCTESEEDPRQFTLDTGVCFFYTITKSDEHYLHHIRMRIIDKYTPPPLGQLLTIYVSDLLAFNRKTVYFSQTRTPIYHAKIYLTPEVHENWKKIEVPEQDQRAGIHKQYWSLIESKKISFEKHSIWDNLWNEEGN